MLPEPATGVHGDVQTCRWWDGTQVITWHLWDHEYGAEDDSGATWLVRKCMICGAPDEAYLHKQWEEKGGAG